MAEIRIAQPTAVQAAKTKAQDRRDSIESDLVGPRVVDLAAEIYTKPTSKQRGVQSPLDWVAIKTGAAHYDSTGKLVHSGTVFDTHNVLGHRSKKIQELINDDDFRAAIKKGPDANGRYSALSDWDRHINKITDEDLTKAAHSYQIDALANNKDYRALLRDLTPEQRAKITSTSDMGEVLDIGENNAITSAQRTELRGMDEGTAALEAKRKELGRDLTQSELETLKTDLRPKQTLAKRAKETHREAIDASKSTRDLNTASIASSKAATELARVNAINKQSMAEAEVALKNKEIGYNFRTSEAERKQDYETSNLDRELRKDLAILGLEDKQSGREFEDRKDARSNRQMMILQMMKGFQGLGQSFGGY